MKIPFVTVVVCNYNYGQYIKYALQSIVEQNYAKNKLAIVVVDDGSTDNSWQEITGFCKTKEKKWWHEGYAGDVKFLAHRLPFNHGPSYARNRAIEKALEFSDCFAILDADDQFYKNKLSKCVSMLYSNEMVGSVYADYDVLNVDTGIKIREYKEPYSRKRLLEECIVHSGSVIKKEALLDCKEAGFYDEELRTCEDYDLWLRIAAKYMMIHVPEPLTLVRVTSKNSTNSVNKSLWEANWLRIYNKRARNGTV